ncbi:uncharacterized protein B0H18DRAFT_969968 [Fomitopsis serialis]|uniref:uncharacterized protein n=1 Tax=Fomitopsis serialis TaxID=139415 RepID=UPI002008E3AC|nr:uncharacterized protein B0H18DRAFT_969968 [Neoantrodia serialis]KAH9937293.1 hypothetical protein B0H18DRAFT_969968 [Neoantrodia serialis]
MTSIRERLLAIEAEFLSSVVSGTAALETFSDQWRDILADVASAVEMSNLDEETISLAHAVSSNIDAFASSFEDFFVAADEIQTTMDTELEDALSRLVLGTDEGEQDLSMAMKPSPFITSAESSLEEKPTWRSASYPSPASSRTPSLVSDSWSEDSDDEDDDVFLDLSHKRLRQEDDPEELIPCHKRRRFISYTSTDTCMSWLHGLDSHDAPEVRGVAPRKILPLPSRTSSVSTELNSSLRPCVSQRKRRLSQTDAYPAPKRPRGINTDTRRQAVSAPLTGEANDLEEQTHDIVRWAWDYKTIAPATYAPPDPSIPMEVRVGWGRPAASELTSSSMAGCCSVTASDKALKEKRKSGTLAEVASSADTDAVDPSSNETSSGTSVAMASVPLAGTDDMPIHDIEETSRAPVTLAAGPTRSSMVAFPDSPTSLSSMHVMPGTGSEQVSSNMWDGPHSRSQSPLGAPPSFDSAVANPSLVPPSYTVDDPYLPSGSITPPPPYRLASETKAGTSDNIAANALDVMALFAELLPLAFHGQKRGFSEAFHQHVQVPQAGMAIAV